MLRTIGCSLFAVLLPTTTSLAAEEHWLQNYFDAKGGCGQHRLAFNQLDIISTDVRRNIPRGGNPEVFGKLAGDWTDQDISDAVGLYLNCESQIDARQKSSCMASGYSQQHCDRGPNPVSTAAAQRIERSLHEIVSLVRERVGVQQRQEAAQQAQDAAMAIRKQKMAEDDVRRKQQELAEQTERDRAAADEAARRAEAEGPNVAEAVKQAEEARKAREAAERRLAEIRSKIDAETRSTRHLWLMHPGSKSFDKRPSDKAMLVFQVTAA